MIIYIKHGGGGGFCEKDFERDTDRTLCSEQEKPLVSVLLPAYNVDKYLARCIESIIHQTYRNLEIIIVDDCSPDNSGIIAEEYARKYPKIKVYHHPKNLGISGARNTGLEKSKGEYVTFVDSDDWIEPDYVEYLLGIAKKTGGDIVLSKNFFTSQFRKQIKKDKIYTITPDEMLYDIFYNRIHVGVWNRLYKRTVLEGKYFRLQSKTGEGMQFNTQVIPAAKSIGVGLRRIYTYNVHNDTSATKMPNINKQALGAVETMDFIKANLKPRNAHLDNAVEYQYFTTALYALGHIIRTNKKRDYPDFYKFIIDYCRKTAPSTLKMETSSKQKLKSLLVWISPYFAVKASIIWRYKLGIKQKV